MKVLNKEVEECCLCPCLDHLDMDGSPYCNMLQKDIKDCNTIDKDCLFNKPITKEVIEGFGFTWTHKNNNSTKYFEKNVPILLNTNLKKDYWYIRFEDTCNRILITEGEYQHTRFFGTINNPVELEFILQSVGAIESK